MQTMLIRGAVRPLFSTWLIQASIFGLFLPSSVAAEGFSLQGSAKIRMWMPSGATQEQATVFFKVDVKHCKWLARMVTDEGTNPFAPDYAEASCDGTNIYSLCSIKSAVERERKKGAKAMAPNVANGHTYKGQVPYERVGGELGPIWLACASGCYFMGRTNDLVEPAMMFDGMGGQYGPPKHKQLRARWTLSDSEPRFPVQVVYLSDGSIQSPMGPAKLPRPYNAGFAHAIYQVEALTNFNGLTVPLEASLKIFEPKIHFPAQQPEADGQWKSSLKLFVPPIADAVSAADLKLFVEYRLNFTNATRTVNVVEFQPALPGVTSVNDERYGQLYYFATNGWPSVETLRTGAYFEELRRINRR